MNKSEVLPQTDVQTRFAVAAASTNVVELKKIAPGSDSHATAMSRLTELLANEPGALEELLTLQKAK